jgi:biopolymer transport protein ExbD
MNLKQAIGKDKRGQDVDVNIIPVMNIFLLLIPFLLLTAAFVRLAVIELSLPSLNKDQSKQIQERTQKLVLVILAIKETGFQLKAQGFKFDPLYKVNNQYDYRQLVEQLKQIKQTHPYAEDIFISPENKVKYNIIIKVMDSCRETGFPNISLSG